MCRVVRLVLWTGITGCAARGKSASHPDAPRDSTSGDTGVAGNDSGAPRATVQVPVTDGDVIPIYNDWGWYWIGVFDVDGDGIDDLLGDGSVNSAAPTYSTPCLVEFGNSLEEVNAIPDLTHGAAIGMGETNASTSDAVWRDDIRFPGGAVIVPFGAAGYPVAGVGGVWSLDRLVKPGTSLDAASPDLSFPAAIASAENLGDVDGDGLDDIEVAAWEDGISESIYAGSSIETAVGEVDNELDHLPQATIYPIWDFDPVGIDLDGDGVNEVARAESSTAADVTPGAVIVFSSDVIRAGGDLTMEDVEVEFDGPTFDSSAWSRSQYYPTEDVGTPGDVDGDGLVDLTVDISDQDGVHEEAVLLSAGDAPLTGHVSIVDYAATFPVVAVAGPAIGSPRNPQDDRVDLMIPAYEGVYRVAAEDLSTVSRVSDDLALDRYYNPVTGAGAATLGIGDFNGDGSPDLAFLESDYVALLYDYRDR